jgi:diaminohydroxyphosphoribosylaminopyrimidine deaminase/5-amino-6-(5-phosphoribosylamino)uracil reductase
LLAAGADVVRLPGADGLLDLAAVLCDLGRRQINELLVEAGPGVAGQLLQQGLVDEFIIYQAPHIMGSETLRMFATPGWTQLTDRQELRIIDITQLGDDLRITAIPAN